MQILFVLLHPGWSYEEAMFKERQGFYLFIIIISLLYCNCITAPQ